MADLTGWNLIFVTVTARRDEAAEAEFHAARLVDLLETDLRFYGSRNVRHPSQDGIGDTMPERERQHAAAQADLNRWTEAVRLVQEAIEMDRMFVRLKGNVG